MAPGCPGVPFRGLRSSSLSPSLPMCVTSWSEDLVAPAPSARGCSASKSACVPSMVLVGASETSATSSLLRVPCETCSLSAVSGVLGACSSTASPSGWGAAVAWPWPRDLLGLSVCGLPLLVAYEARPPTPRRQLGWDLGLRLSCPSPHLRRRIAIHAAHSGLPSLLPLRAPASASPPPPLRGSDSTRSSLPPLRASGSTPACPSSLAGVWPVRGRRVLPCGSPLRPWPSRVPLRVFASTEALASSLAGVCSCLTSTPSLRPVCRLRSRRWSLRTSVARVLPMSFLSWGSQSSSLRRSTLQVSTPAPSLQPGWCGVASAEGCHAPRHVPSMPFSTTSTACSTWALRASCSSLPTLGFITFQARSSHPHACWSLPKELPALSRGRAACGARRCRSTTPEGAAVNSSRRCCSAERAVSRPIRFGFPNLRRLPAPPSDARPRPLFSPCPSRFPEGSRAELGAPCSVPTFTPRGGDRSCAPGLPVAHLGPLQSGVSLPRSPDDPGGPHPLAEVAAAAAELRQAESTPAAPCGAPRLRTWVRSRRSHSSPCAPLALAAPQTPMLPGRPKSAGCRERLHASSRAGPAPRRVSPVPRACLSSARRSTRP